MRTLFIPTIGETITLAAPWTFTVHNEHRNETLIEWMGKRVAGDGLYSHPLGEVKRKDGGRDWDASSALTVKCTLPKGTVLRIDRIYIRKNLKDFDSVTFFLKDAKTVQSRQQRIARQVKIKPGFEKMSPFDLPHNAYEHVDIPYTSVKPARPVRFWAKLAEVNGMKIK